MISFCWTVQGIGTVTGIKVLKTSGILSAQILKKRKF